jgi:hypothetical protein
MLIILILKRYSSTADIRKEHITMTDLRIYCTEDYKKQVKTAAVQAGISVSDYLLKIVECVIPQQDTRANMVAELEHINAVLATQGGRMTAEERQMMKDRRTTIKQELEKGEKKNG